MHINNAIQYWLSLVIDNNGVVIDRHGMMVAERLALFYAYDGILAAHTITWLQ